MEVYLDIIGKLCCSYYRMENYQSHYFLSNQFVMGGGFWWYDKINNEYKIKLIINMFLHDIIIQGSIRETEHTLISGNYAGILEDWFWPPHEGLLNCIIP